MSFLSSIYILHVDYNRTSACVINLPQFGGRDHTRAEFYTPSCQHQYLCHRLCLPPRPKSVLLPPKHVSNQPTILYIILLFSKAIAACPA